MALTDELRLSLSQLLGVRPEEIVSAKPVAWEVQVERIVKGGSVRAYERTVRVY